MRSEGKAFWAGEIPERDKTRLLYGKRRYTVKDVEDNALAEHDHSESLLVINTSWVEAR